MTERIDEQSRRWPDFQGGRPIELPDEQTWWFYEPAAFNRSGKEGAIVPSWTFGESVDPTVDLVLASKFAAILGKRAKASDESERVGVGFEAAWFLLARNYNLTPDEFEAIMAKGVAWSDPRQTALGRSLGSLVDDACSRSLARAEVA